MAEFHRGLRFIFIITKRVMFGRKITYLITIIAIISSCRTPESIIRAVCDIDLHEIEYRVITFNESWCLNGDGHCYIEVEIADSASYYYLQSSLIKRGAIPTNRELVYNTRHCYPKEHKGLFLIWQNNIQGLIEDEADNSVLVMLDEIGRAHV